MELYKFAKLIRSKNAGPYMLSIDILFESKDYLEYVIASDILTSSLISELYSVPEVDIQLFVCWEANALKFSFPRHYIAGNFEDDDVFGGQFHAPLVNIDIT